MASLSGSVFTKSQAQTQEPTLHLVRTVSIPGFTDSGDWSSLLEFSKFSLFSDLQDQEYTVT